MRRFWEPDEADHLVHQRGRWVVHCHVHGDPRHDESGFRFEHHAFIPGEYVSITEPDYGLRASRVVSVREID